MGVSEDKKKTLLEKCQRTVQQRRSKAEPSPVCLLGVNHAWKNAWALCLSRQKQGQAASSPAVRMSAAPELCHRLLLFSWIARHIKLVFSQKKNSPRGVCVSIFSLHYTYSQRNTHTNFVSIYVYTHTSLFSMSPLYQSFVYSDL